MKLPKRYVLSVEVKLIEVPNQFAEPPEPFVPSSDDPMKAATEFLGRMGNTVLNPPMISLPFQHPAGFEFHKSCSVTVSDFMGLSRIICDFDELVKVIEEQHP